MSQWMEIDTELFITCRLCVQDKGIFQIVPSVQQLIKYCFDINVEPFDGLSQIICRKCKGILDSYNTYKTTFNQNQEKLLKRLILSNLEESTIETVQDVPKITNREEEKSNNHDSIPNITQQKKKKKNKKKTQALSSSDSEDEEIVGSHNTKKEEIVGSHNTKKDDSNILREREQSENIQSSALSWRKHYQLLFVCRYCYRQLSTRSMMWKHLQSHETLRKLRCSIVSKHCKVTLKKIEGESYNVTGKTNIVVLTPSNFICEEGNVDYFSTYVPKNLIATNFFDISSLHKPSTQYSENNLRKTKRYQCTEVISSDDEFCSRPKIRKRIRLVSTSSVDTVLVDDNSNKTPNISDYEPNELFENNEVLKQPSDNEFISVDDVSTDASETNKNLCNQVTPITGELQEKQIKKMNISGSKQSDYKTIFNIVSMSYNKYLKKIESIAPARESQVKTGPLTLNKHEDSLNRKLLSIGRKVMSKSGVTSKGLLKYLENKNLGVDWHTNKFNSSKAVAGKDEYVRIMARPQEPNTENKYLTGFVVYKDTDLRELQEENFLGNNLSLISPSTNIPPNEATIQRPVIATMPAPVLMTLLNDSSSTCASIVLNNAGSSQQTNSQLLNESPVANPKQAPKKKSPLDIKPNIATVDKADIIRTVDTSKLDHNYEVNLICIDSDDEQVSRLPVITSTTSLAAIPEVKCKNTKNNLKSDQSFMNSDNTNVDTKNLPRIKCKPVTELMSASALNNYNHRENSNSRPLTNGRPLYITNVVSNNNLSTTHNTLEIIPVTNSHDSSQQEPTKFTHKEIPSNCVVLHTITLPNTITHSPFTYLKNLLSIHSLYLVSSEEKSLKDFICLVRFKLDVRQEDKSIVLCLAMGGSKQHFYLDLKDCNQENIDVTKMTAFWQWEVIKAFQDIEVANKMKSCAGKVSHSFLANVNLLTTLLRSIELKCDY